ncbi:MAG: ABC transporter ATP-binding protein, partial [Rhizobiaceae bacterium]|nr:ABC transporter ATP-binding protein [Rhizobiaceae bacterium]
MAVSLYRYTWMHTRRQQLWMLFVVALSIPALFLSLNLPKLIVNGPIQGEGFESETATQSYLGLSIPMPDWLVSGGQLALFDGVDLTRLNALYVLSGFFLLLVIVNGWFKYYLNTFKGRLGERMLRRMRYEFVDLVLRFPILRFRQLRAPEVASMIKDELEPIGGFIGEAFVTPVFLLSQILTAIVFIFVQSVSLGLVAMGVMGIQVVLIPRMRRRLLVLGRQRQLTARQFAGRVGEIVEGIASVHTNDTSNWERAGVSEELGRIFLIRFDIYQWKFLVKFLNNFLAQVTPFIFYLFGGYYAITGQLDIGQLVAVIAAYKDLPSPLKDLIDWDQIRLDVQVKYEQVVEQFDVDNISEAALQAPAKERVAPLAGAFVLSGLTAQEEADGRLFEDVTVDLPLTQKVAVVAGVGEGAEHVAEVMARLRPPSAGQITLGDEPLGAVPEAVTGRRLAYVDATTYLPRSSLRDSLLYGLRHYPVLPAEREKTKTDALAVHETKRSGNTQLDIADGWIDFEDLGLASETDLGPYVAEILSLVMLERDVRLFGLRTRVPEKFVEEVSATVLKSRLAFRETLEAEGMESYVEAFDPDRYIVNATIMENIVFGAPRDARLGLAQFFAHPYARETGRATGLAQNLFEMGRDIAVTMIDLFGDLEPGNPLLQRISIMTPEELKDYRQVIMRVAGRSFDQAGATERLALIRLALSYVEPRHRLGLIDEAFQNRV